MMRIPTRNCIGRKVAQTTPRQTTLLTGRSGGTPSRRRSGTGLNRCPHGILALDEREGRTSGRFRVAGFVTIHSQTKEITRSGQYWAFAHFSRQGVVGRRDLRPRVRLRESTTWASRIPMRKMYSY